MLVMLAVGAPEARATPTTDIFGLWMTRGDEARIEIFQCGEEICGRIAWIPAPNNADGTAKLDVHNKDAALRGRPLVGLQLMNGFKPTGPRKWTGGTIYSARTGKTHRVTLELVGPDRLKVGKWLFGQIWRRTEQNR